MNDNLYKCLVSFTTETTQYQLGQIIELTDEALIQDLINAKYIEVYDGALEIAENGIYEVEGYDSVDVNVEGSSEEVDALVDEINGEVI